MAKLQKIDQEQDLFGITGDVFRLIKPCWAALKLNLSTFMLIILLPITIAMLVLVTGGWAMIFNGDFSALNIASVSVLGLILLFTSLVAWPAMIITQLESAKKKIVDYRVVISKSLKIALPFLGLSILIGLITVLGFVLVIIPGFLAIFFLTIAPFIYVDKKVSAVDAIKESYHLTKANWRLIFAMYIVNFAVSFLGYFPIVGWIINLVLSIAYFCLPAVVYLQIRK